MLRILLVLLSAMSWYLLGYDAGPGRHLSDNSWWLVFFCAVVSFVGACCYVKENKCNVQS